MASGSRSSADDDGDGRRPRVRGRPRRRTGGAAPVGPTAVYDSDDRPPFYAVLVPRRQPAELPDPRAGRHRPARRARGREQPGGDRPPGCAAVLGVDRARTGCSSTAAARPRMRSSARSASTGWRSSRASPASGGFRAPAVTTDGAFRGYVAPGRRRRTRSSSRPATARIAMRVDVEGDAAIDFSPTASDLAFIAPDAPGREDTLPVGPLRLAVRVDRRRPRALAGSRRGVLLVTDGRTIAALQVRQSTDDNVAGAPRRRHGAGSPARRMAAPAARASGSGSSSSIAATGDDPVEAERPARRPVRRAAPPLLRPVRAEPPHLVGRQPRDRAAGRRRRRDDRIVAIPADGGAATRIADGVAAAWSP